MGWFGSSFNASKTSIALKLCLGRVRLVTNKKRAIVQNMRRDVSQQMEDDRYDTARIRVENILREKGLIIALEHLEIFLELIAARVRHLEQTSGLPDDMREAVASVIYASSRLMDVPELTQVAQGLGGKFGRDFVRACSCERAEDLPKDVREKHPENPRSWVSRQLVAGLSVAPPAQETKMAQLRSIATEYNITIDEQKATGELSTFLAKDLPPLLDMGTSANGAKGAAAGSKGAGTHSGASPEALADLYGEGNAVGLAPGTDPKSLVALRSELQQAAQEARATAQQAADAARAAADAASRYESLRRRYEDMTTSAAFEVPEAGTLNAHGDGADRWPLPEYRVDGKASPEEKAASGVHPIFSPGSKDGRLGDVPVGRVVSPAELAAMNDKGGGVDFPDLSGPPPMNGGGGKMDLPDSFGVRRTSSSNAAPGAPPKADVDDLMKRFEKLKKQSD